MRSDENPAPGGRVTLAAPRGLAVPLIEVTVADRLDLATLPRIRGALDRVLQLAPRQLVIDLAGCTHIDAAAIGLLLDIHRQLWRTDGQLSLRAPTPRLRRILRAARVDHVLHVMPDTAQDSPPDAPAAAARGRAPVHQHVPDASAQGSRLHAR